MALVGFSASAHAGDLEDIKNLKDPLPDTLSWHGVTVYGTIDLGYAYQTNGRPLGGIVSDLEYSPFNATRNFTGKPVSTLTGSGLEQSKIGVKIEEGIGFGWTAIGKLEAGFDPMSGQLSDGCGSMLENIGRPVSQQTSSGDSGRCGQAFNGVAYAGVSNASYGTLTVGRQNSL
jgi:predicted porin